MFLEFGNIWIGIGLGFFRFSFFSSLLFAFHHCGPGPGRKRQKQEGLTTDWRLFRFGMFFRFFAVRQSYALFYYILDACICRFGTIEGWLGRRRWISGIF
jgi:hypothetical protein